MKKAVMMVMAVAGIMTARAELLYFMASAYNWHGPLLFDYALVGVARDGELDWGDSNEYGGYVYLDVKSSYDATTSSIVTESDDNDFYAVGWADISDYTSDEYTFYIETWSDDDDEEPVMGYSESTAKSYAQLKAGNHIYIEGETAPQNVTIWLVPEPTSGMLVWLGLAVVALRRRKKVSFNE